MENCILCSRPLTGSESPEHILLNALGGRKTVRSVICSACNRDLGHGPDQELADSVLELRNIANLKAGDRDDAPHIIGLEIDGQLFDYRPGGIPVQRIQNPLKVEWPDGRPEVSIKAINSKRAAVLAEHAARKILSDIGYRNPPYEFVTALTKAVGANGVLSLRPAPTLDWQVQFGSEGAQRAMAKATLVLWALSVGNEEVLSPSYDEIREFVSSGLVPPGAEALATLDTRDLPNLPDRFGTNPNMVWVGSDAAGRVIGYFRLYGALGWRFLLRSEGGPKNRSLCLISNPFDPAIWANLENEDSLLSFSWVEFDEIPTPENINFALRRFGAIMKKSREHALDRAYMDAIRDAFARYNVKEGDNLDAAHFEGFSHYLARRLVAIVTKTPFEEEITLRRASDAGER